MIRINRWICLCVGLWRSLRCGVPVDGCDLVTAEENVPALVTTSQCAVCGRWNIEWVRVKEDGAEIALQ